MSVRSWLGTYLCNFRFTRLASPAALAACGAFLAGCGGGGSGARTTFSGNTNVVLLASSTANDQLQHFGVTLNSLTLTSQSGANAKTVNLISTPVGDEFIHLNGLVEPLASVAVPQGIYASASANVSMISPACAGQAPGILLTDGAVTALAPTATTIDLTAPITVSGDAMGLILNLQVAKSTPFSGNCTSASNNGPQVPVVFTLTPMSIASQPTNSTNGRILGLRGVIGSVAQSGTGVTVNGLGGYNTGVSPAWTLAFDGSTVFQGVSGASQLGVGSAVEMDANMQQDGSLLATRAAALDTNTTNLSLGYGRPVAIYPAGAYGATYPVMDMLAVEQTGRLAELIGLYSMNDATFQISGEMANVQTLPFTASFDAGNMVDGQNVLFTSHGATDNTIPALTAVTLLPQTINGMVSAISSAGGFTAYTVTLAGYDMFPNLAVQGGQTTLLTNPNTVVVYADGNTQMLNSSAIAVGSLERFYGLIFNDNGTLRMDCAQVNDGVAE
jgi:hypothetical protein